MPQRVFIAICLVCLAGHALAQAYRWVDEDGVVHYSDRPREGAERIELPDNTTTTRIIIPQGPEPSGDEDGTDADEQAYESLEIASPGAEETLWNIEGTLEVSLNLRPALKPDHRVRVYFDGEPRMVNGTSFTIPEVYRGVHNIQAEVVDEAGQMLIRSRTNRFYVQQTSIAGSNRPNAFPR